jgi:hypothetical protein
VLERLTFQNFAPAIGQRFALTGGDAPSLDLELLEASPQNPEAPAADAAGKRAPFSLLFRGPSDPVLPQHIYKLEHNTLGVLEIFLVPVGTDETGTTYQAVFG